jgi:hypothetical protein
MPIDLSTVNWVFVALMAVFAFVAALLGNLIAFRNLFVGSILTAILFAAMFVGWNYYPHDDYVNAGFCKGPMKQGFFQRAPLQYFGHFTPLPRERG